MELSPDILIQKRTIGKEEAPLLVIDNFVKQPDELARRAASKIFVPTGRYFPGVRAKAPLSYQRFLIASMQPLLLEFFELEGNPLRVAMCHFSLVTTPPEKLEMPQRIPHLDAVAPHGLASIHYLFRKGYGGTAFYRHRRTGFEYVDESRQEKYFKSLGEQMNGPDAPGPAYINGDTPLFEQVGKHDGLYNRILFYRQNSLHSGCIDSAFVADAEPATGRLSINSFIDTG